MEPAIENVVGIQLAANKPDYAVSVILNSSLQVALALVLLSFVVSDTLAADSAAVTGGRAHAIDNSGHTCRLRRRVDLARRRRAHRAVLPDRLVVLVGLTHAYAG